MSEQMVKMDESQKLIKVLQAAQGLAASNNNTKSSPKPPIVLLCTGDLLAAINKLLATLKKDGYTMNQIEKDQMTSKFNFGCSSAEAQGKAQILEGQGMMAAGTVMMASGGLMIGMAAGGIVMSGMEAAELSDATVAEEEEGAGVGGIARADGQSGGAGASGADEAETPEARAARTQADLERASQGNDDQGRAMVSREEGSNRATNEARLKEKKENISKKWTERKGHLNKVFYGAQTGSQGPANYYQGYYKNLSATQTVLAGNESACKDSMDSAQRSTNTTQQGAVQSFGSLSSGATQSVTGTIIASSQGTR